MITEEKKEEETILTSLLCLLVHLEVFVCPCFTLVEESGAVLQHVAQGVVVGGDFTQGKDSFKTISSNAEQNGTLLPVNQVNSKRDCWKGHCPLRPACSWAGGETVSSRGQCPPQSSERSGAGSGECRCVLLH